MWVWWTYFVLLVAGYLALREAAGDWVLIDLLFYVRVSLVAQDLLFFLYPLKAE